jgi:hypothetical protein
MGKNWIMAGEGYKILFTAHHGDENQTALDALAGGTRWGCKKIWDAIRDFGSLETKVYQNKFPEELIPVVFEAIMENYAVVGVIQDYDLKLSGGDIWMIQCRYEEFEARWLAFMNILRDGWMTVSGDDTFFDYYPDLWFIADQISAIGAEIFSGKGGFLPRLEMYRQHVVNMMYDAWNDGFDLIGANGFHLDIKRKMLYEGYLKEVSKKENGQGRFEYTEMGKEFLKKEGLWVL